MNNQSKTLTPTAISEMPNSEDDGAEEMCR
jgi:hypothetical protein